jgi:HK97 family phage portal protein
MIQAIKRLFQPKNEQITHPSQLQGLLIDSLREVASGVTVNAQTAMAVPAINRGVNLLASMIAMLPLELYAKTDDGKEKATNHPQYDFIKKRPNDFMTAYQFRYLMTRHMVLNGNGYAAKLMAGNQVKRLVPVHYNRVTPEQDENWNIRYKTMMPSGMEKIYTPRNLWHLRPNTDDGLNGLGIVKECRESIGMCIAAEMHGAMLFGNGQKPGGILSTEAKLKKEQVDRIRESWGAAFGGKNKYGTAVLDGGMKWEQTGMDNESAQYLEIRQFQVEEVARMLGIPAILLYSSTSTATFASSKELVQAFLKFSLDPWLTYWEAEYNQNILSPADQDRYFVKFTRQALEKMDLSSRAEVYEKLIASRVFNPNECRELEERNRVDGLDSFENPNITPGAPGQGADDED